MNITSYADSWLRLMQMGFEGNLAGQDLLNFEISIGAIIMILLVIIAGCIQLIAIERQRQHQAALRQSILGSQMISAGNFLGNWKTTKSGNKVTGGYKMLDQPGCYVIVTSPSPDGKAYEKQVSFTAKAGRWVGVKNGMFVNHNNEIKNENQGDGFVTVDYIRYRCIDNGRLD